MHSEDETVKINCAEARARVAPICAFSVVFDEKTRKIYELELSYSKSFVPKKFKKVPEGGIFCQIVKNPFFLFGF